MMAELSYIIIGNGIAGVTAAQVLRAEDSAADITVIADDPFPVYYRPALKDYLAGRVREDKLWARPTSFYEDHRVRFLKERVVRVQAGQHIVQLQGGREVGYSRLLLANGANPSRLKCPGLDLKGVTGLRTVADYQAVLSQLTTTRNIVVTGSGTLALETIETLRHRGYAVTHLLRKSTLWSEVLDATASDLVLQQERRDGVDLRLEEEIAEITGKAGKVTGVVTTSGARIPCDMVIMAIGVEPIIDFIKSSGIGCGRGVRVDGAMRTNAPDIYAAGDVLETTDAMTGKTRVIGQWFPAISQARAAAYSMLDLLDTSRPFRPGMFYNATFLYGLEFACVGLTQVPKEDTGYQEIVADPEPRTYRKVILKDGVPVGVLSLGNRKGTLDFKRAIDHSVNLSSVASRLFAPDFKLKAWLDQQGVPPAILGANREGAAAVKQIAYTGGTIAGGAINRAPTPQPIIEASLVPAAQTNELGATQLAETVLSQTKVMTIGRQVGVYMLIDHGTVSRRHAEISYANGQYVLRDLGSSNGTFVNDKRLEPGSVHVLNSGDRILFGKVPFRFQARQADGKEIPSRQASSSKTSMTKLYEMVTGFYDPAASAKEAPTGQPVISADGSLMLPGATQAVPANIVALLKETPALIVITRGDPQVFQLKPGKRLVMGRDKKNDIVLPEVAASRKHAEVYPGPDGFYIHDLGSSNGVIVNSTKIDNPYRLANSDRITIGSILVYFIYPQAPQQDIEIQPPRHGGAEGFERRSAEDNQLANDAGASTASQSGKLQGVRSAQVGVINRPLQAGTQCPNCGTPNPDRARFCANCGGAINRPPTGM
jgi:NADPH-dependent 2,4-dienoyl-CoA reductase/sulfur reductase-like enzyme/pSer/pThr/pTyr-binding forkhead associated (FHA) protein